MNERRRLFTSGLGPLNPQQALFNISNSQLWFLYGCLLSDYYIALACATGLASQLYYVSTCIGLMGVSLGRTLLANPNPDDKEQKAIARDMGQYKNLHYAFVILVSGYSLFYTITFSYFKIEMLQAKIIIGNMCAIHNYLYYIKYTPQLYIIIRKKDASSIIPCLAIADMLNSFAWTAYGVVLKNNNIVYPSLVGIAYSIMFATTYCLYGKNKGVEHDMLQMGDKGEYGIDMPISSSVINVSTTHTYTHPHPHSDNSANESKGTGGLADMDMEMNTLDSYLNQEVVFSDHDQTHSLFMESPKKDISSNSSSFNVIDNGMEYLANFGRSRSNSLLIDPIAEYDKTEIDTAMNENITNMSDLMINSNLIALTNTVANTVANVSLTLEQQCTNCNKIIYIETARFCWNCGYSVVPSQTQSTHEMNTVLEGTDGNGVTNSNEISTVPIGLQNTVIPEEEELLTNTK